MKKESVDMAEQLAGAFKHLADYKGILGDSYVRTYCLEKLAQYRKGKGEVG